MSHYPTLEQWVNAFNQHLKLKSFEQFSLLLCEIGKCDDTQKTLLYNILFDDHKNPKYWNDYVNYVVHLFPERKQQLQRLASKAIETIDEKVYRDDESYIQLNILYAMMKSDLKDSVKYFQNVIWKKQIGRKYAAMYTAWAGCEKNSKNISKAIDILQKGLLSNAEPRLSIKRLLVDINSELKLQRSLEVNEVQKANETAVQDLRSEKKRKLVISGQFLEFDNIVPTTILSSDKSAVTDNLEDISPKTHINENSNDNFCAVRTQIDDNSVASNTINKFNIDDVIVSVKNHMLDNFSDTDSIIEETKPLPALADMIQENNSLDCNSDNSNLQNIDIVKEESNYIVKKTVSFDVRGTTSIDKSTSKKRGLSCEDNNLNSIVMSSNGESKSKTSANTNGQQRNEKLSPIDSSVASESVFKFDFTSLIELNNHKFHKLSILGKGGSSTVYKVISQDLQHTYAYKRVNVKSASNDDDTEAILDSYINEIELLRNLAGCHGIINLIDAEVNRHEMYVAMIMEIGETDLAKVLSQRQKTKDGDFVGINPFYMRLVWYEMLQAVDCIHNHRIVHGDLKPANFVFVNGHLKLIDFGIAKAFSNDTTNIYRESQIGTVNYMAPEAISPTSIDNSDGDKSSTNEANVSSGYMRLGRASDIWSLGCILYQILYGRPPFAHLTTIQKLHAIPNAKFEITYGIPPEPLPPLSRYQDDYAIETIKSCLCRDPRLRASIQSVNNKPGLMQQPFLCPPKSVTLETVDNNLQIKDDGLNKLDREFVKDIIKLVFNEMQNEYTDATQQNEYVESIFSNLMSRKNTTTAIDNNLDDNVSSEEIIILQNVKSKPKSLDNTISIKNQKKIIPTVSMNQDCEQKRMSDDFEDIDNVTSTVSLTTKVLPTKKNAYSQVKILKKEIFPQLTLKSRSIAENKLLQSSKPISSYQQLLNTAEHVENTQSLKKVKESTRKPLKALPVTLQDQILMMKDNPILDNMQSSSRASKWMKPKQMSPEKDDLKSVLERRIGAIRQFLQTDDDENLTSNDFTDGQSFF